MDLIPEQLKTIEQLGGLHYTPAKVAMYLDLDKKEFLAEFNTAENDEQYRQGNVRYHYDRGLLMAQAEIDKANLKRAKDGNLTSVALYKKDVVLQNFDNAKHRILYTEETNKLEELRGLIERGETSNMPVPIVEYYDQVEYIRSLYLRWQSKSYILNAIMLKWPHMTRRTATVVYNETLNYFYLDNDIKVETWRNMYAERLDNLAALAAEMNDLEQARRCTIDAAELRGLNKEKPPVVPLDLLEKRPVIYINDITIFGIPAISRRALAEKIENMDIPKTQKTRLLRESQVQDVEFEVMLLDEASQDQ